MSSQPLMRKILATLAQSLACAIAIVLAFALSACAGAAHFYSTVLDAPDGLGPGDPVIHAGTPIGTVTGVAPLAGGDSQAAITINPGYSKIVRVDSILILSGTGTGPSLELENRDPSSLYAPQGEVLYGASNLSQAQLFESSLGPPTIVKSYADLFGKMSGAAPTPSPAAGATPSAPNVLSQQLQQLTRQTLDAAAALAGASPPSAAQMDDFRHDAAAVERQLRAHGKTAEADQLKASVDQMNAAAAAGAPAASATPAVPPNTLTVPSAAAAKP
ncbi:MAG: MlaD family protein [Candidatus Binataceae bacterium]